MLASIVSATVEESKFDASALIPLAEGMQKTIKYEKPEGKRKRTHINVEQCWTSSTTSSFVKKMKKRYRTTKKKGRKKQCQTCHQSSNWSKDLEHKSRKNYKCDDKRKKKHFHAKNHYICTFSICSSTSTICPSSTSISSSASFSTTSSSTTLSTSSSSSTTSTSLSKSHTRRNHKKCPYNRLCRPRRRRPIVRGRRLFRRGLSVEKHRQNSRHQTNKKHHTTIKANPLRNRHHSRHITTDEFIESSTFAHNVHRQKKISRSESHSIKPRASLPRSNEKGKSLYFGPTKTKHARIKKDSTIWTKAKPAKRNKRRQVMEGKRHKTFRKHRFRQASNSYTSSKLSSSSLSLFKYKRIPFRLKDYIGEKIHKKGIVVKKHKRRNKKRCEKCSSGSNWTKGNK